MILGVFPRNQFLKRMGDKDLIAQQEARDAVEAASFAFQSVAKLDQAKIDEICEAMARVALAESARLGKMASEETGFGKAEDKREKNRFAAEDVWNYFRDLKTVGVVKDNRQHCRDRQPARRCRGDYSLDQSDIYSDLQDHHRDQIPQYDRSFTASVGRGLHRRNNPRYARCRNKSGAAGRCDHLS